MMEIQPVAHIRSDFKEKFGIPRQSGLVEALRAAVIFTPEYRVFEAVRGLEDFSHICTRSLPVKVHSAEPRMDQGI